MGLTGELQQKARTVRPQPAPEKHALAWLRSCTIAGEQADLGSCLHHVWLVGPEAMKWQTPWFGKDLKLLQM